MAHGDPLGERRSSLCSGSSPQLLAPGVELGGGDLACRDAFDGGKHHEVVPLAALPVVRARPNRAVGHLGGHGDELGEELGVVAGRDRPDEGLTSDEEVRRRDELAHQAQAGHDGTDLLGQGKLVGQGSADQSSGSPTSPRNDATSPRSLRPVGSPAAWKKAKY